MGNFDSWWEEVRIPMGTWGGHTDYTQSIKHTTVSLCGTLTCI